MQQNSALDWSYDRLNYSLRLRQAAATQRGVAPNPGGNGGLYHSNALPIANNRSGDVMDYPVGFPRDAMDGAVLSVSPPGQQLSTSVPPALHHRVLIDQPTRPKSLKKQQKALSRSNSSLDDDMRLMMTSRRDYGSTSSIDLLAKAAEEASKIPTLIPPPASPPTTSCAGASKNRSVHFKSGNKESSSSRAFLKRFRNSAKSSAQQQQKQQPPILPDASFSAGESSGVSSEFINTTGDGSCASLSAPSSRKNFFHFDCQSLMWQPFGDPLWRHCHRSSHRRRNTGASAASSGTRVLSTPVQDIDATASQEAELRVDDHELDDCDRGDGQSNDIVLSCPFFRNELGGESLRVPALTLYTLGTPHDSGEGSASCSSLAPQHCSPSCNAASLLEPLPGRELLGPDGRTPDEEEEWGGGVSRHFWGSQRNGMNSANIPVGCEDNLLMEFIDSGAKYYRKYFEGQAHQNWFGVDEEYGSIAVSLKRERVAGGGVSPPPVSDTDSFVGLSCSGGRSAAANQASQAGSAASGATYLWRVVVRTQRQLVSLRGAIFEEHVPSQCKLSASKGVPVKEVLQHVVPELPLSCLRLGNADAAAKVAKLDEQLLPQSYKVGVLLCRSGQCCEEDMYNNEHSSPALDEFMNLLGQKIKLQNFDKFKGGLDNKADMTGTHSYYTCHRGHEIMFHVSTMLPFTPSNQQQLMRKRHIGNDIVTIIFQEPGAMPFSPKTMRSQFQHIFIVVRAYFPNTDHTRYSIAVSRSCDVPPFGPPIPSAAVFSKSQEFVDFLLTKAMNGENSAHRSPKFLTMALRSREDNLKDLAENYVNTASTLDSKAGGAQTKFFLGSGRKKDKHRGRPDLALQARGALAWHVKIHDYSLGRETQCLIGISWDRLVLIDTKQRCVMTILPCRAVIGWRRIEDNGLKIFYNEGEMLRFTYEHEEDLNETMQRLDVVSPGCQTKSVNLSRAEATNLGFSVHDGNLVVTEVDFDSSPANQGLRQGSRVVELCGRPITILSSDDIQEVLRVALQLTLTFVPPDANNRVRKGIEIADPYLTNRAIKFLRQSSTPSPELSRQRPQRDEERRHTVGHVKLEDGGESCGELAVSNGTGDSSKGFHANLRRLIDPDYTEEDIRNKAVSPSTVDPSVFPSSRRSGPPLQRTISDESLIGHSPLELPRLTSRVATEASLQQDWNRLVNEASQALTSSEMIGSMTRRQFSTASTSQTTSRQTSHNTAGFQMSSNDLASGRYGDLEKRCAELEAQVKKEQESRQEMESECERLRLENAHLRDECSKAAHQLTKFSSWFFSAMDRQLL